MCIRDRQQAPLRAKEVAPANAYQAARKDIRLLSEADTPRSRSESSAAADAVAPEAAVCLFLGTQGSLLLLPDVVEGIK